MTLTPGTIDDLRQCVTDQPCALACGASTKPALSRGTGEVAMIDMTGISGVLTYDPVEFTITALAGTPLREMNAALAENGQWLPFDPPLTDAGATIGGTVAAGLSGAGRLRFGGLRDFLIGVRFVDGEGELVCGGGTVVKNAAGFDLPKLMIGSMGRLGVLAELTFKVFPRPAACATLQVECADLDDTIALLCRLTREPWDLQALDLQPPNVLRLRITGAEATLDGRLTRLTEAIDQPTTALRGDDEAAWWVESNEFSWVPNDAALVKVPLTPMRITALDAWLEPIGAARRYSVAGNVAWIAWPAHSSIDLLDSELRVQQLGGLVLWGDAATVRLGVDPAQTFIQRVKQALDPTHRFPD